MFDKRSIIFTLLVHILFLSGAYAQDDASLDNYDILWKKALTHQDLCRAAAATWE